MATVASEIGVSDWLKLPPVEADPLRYDYGATEVAAWHCGLKKPPDKLPGVWAHGWFPSPWQLLRPDMLFGNRTRADINYWVARREQEQYLHSCGHLHAKAIGLPIVYVRRPPVQRRPGSLLVMPAHSLDYTTHQWRFDEYAEQIDALRADFATVVVCVHPSCFRHGYWVEAFQKRGLPIVQGALAEDRNALLRMATLLSGFEFVTTNAFGSHIAYASYFGAKVSVHGSYAEYRAEDYANTPHYQQNPDLLEHMLRNTSEAEVRRLWPELFCHPAAAAERVDWAERELGADNRLAPARLRSLLGWGWRDRLMARVEARVPAALKRNPARIPRRVLGRLLRALQRVLRPIQSRALTMLGRLPPKRALAIRTHLTDEEKHALYQAALELPPGCTGLEVGSFLGASAAIVGSAIRRRRGVYHCVDTWENQAMDEPERDTWPEFQRNVAFLGDSIVPQRGRSVDIAKTLILPLDFLFIDGDHSEEAADADFRSWLPMVKPGGTVAVHDVGWAEGVKRGVARHLSSRILSKVELPNLLICRIGKEGDGQA